MADIFRKQIRLISHPLSSLLVVGLVLIMAFQNCSGGVEEDESASATVSTGVGGNVDVIDHVRPNEQWSLHEKRIVVANATENLEVDGSCEQEDGVIEWRLGSTSGRARCVKGVFRLSLRPLSEVACGEAEMIIGQQGAHSSLLGRVVRRCEPIATKVVPALDDVLVSDALKSYVVSHAVSCRVEIGSGIDGALSENAERGCTHVCYDDVGVVKQSTDVEGAICSI